MTASTLKLILFLAVVVIIIVTIILNGIKTKKKEELDNNASKIDVDIKDDSYWEKRFNGLKSDYEDREAYHKQRYEQLKSEYESREQFLRKMLEDSRNDYQGIKKELLDIQKLNAELQEKLKAADKMIADYEIKCMKMESRLQDIEDTLNSTKNGKEDPEDQTDKQ